MELNREQIIEALECCGTEHRCCWSCPLKKDYSPCSKTMADNALSLIKELTEKYENLEMQFREIDHECDRLEIRNDELDEENERLRADNEQYRKATEKSVKRMQDKIMVECEEQIDKIKAELEGK